jgi:hypothetical protein
MTIDELKIEVIAAFILYKSATAFKHTFEYLTPLWISAQLHETKMLAQYDLAQTKHIKALKALKD